MTSNESRRTPRIGITLGDFNGVGPEITLKCLAVTNLRAASRPLLLGPVDVYRSCAKRLGLRMAFSEVSSLAQCDDAPGIPVYGPMAVPRAAVTPGSPTRESGDAAILSLSLAAALCRSGAIDAMVTAPVSKEGMMAGGFPYAGQTEFLAAATGAPGVLMMLVSGALRVALATVHLPLRRVSAAITPRRLTATLGILSRSLRRDFGIARPRVAVLGLNPHAGEGGAIGTEEQRVIIPLLRRLRAKGLSVDGPFPADGYFGAGEHRRFDATLALYHDQGLIPFKQNHFTDGVNFSAGLPIIRTSPDHGTAFAIAGRNRADASSMAAAIELAIRLAERRHRA